MLDYKKRVEKYDEMTDNCSVEKVEKMVRRLSFVGFFDCLIEFWLAVLLID